MCHSSTFGTQGRVRRNAIFGTQGKRMGSGTVILLELSGRGWDVARWHFWDSGEGDGKWHSGTF
jgi:hypothetical protein